MDPMNILSGSTPSVTLDFRYTKPRVKLSRTKPRPTRLTVFNWKPTVKTMRIMVQEGARREV